MSTLRAFVRNRRLIMNEPTDLPEGTAIELVAMDPADELDEEERSRLHAALQKSWASAQAGRLFSAEKILHKLKGK